MTEAPAARRDPKRIEQLGRVRVDDYHWMKDDSWQQVMRDPALLRADIRAHLEAENAYAGAAMAGTEALQERIFQEIKGRIKEDDSSVPAPDGPWEYYSRYAIGAQHPVYARRPRGAETPEHLLLDCDALAKDKAYCKVAVLQHAPNHALVGYAVDEQGSEIYAVRVIDLASGATLPAPIENCTGDFAWSPCSRFIFWVFREENGRPSKVFRRPAHGTGADDVLVYDEPDEGFFLSVHASESRAFILIGCGNQETSEFHVIPAATPEATPVVFHPREDGVRYTPTHWDGQWLVLTNADGAIDFKIAACPLGQSGRAHWRDHERHKPGRYITDLLASRDFLVRLERAEGLPRLSVRRLDGEEHAVAFAEQAYALDAATGFEFEASWLRFLYQSPTTPGQTYDYDMATRERVLRKTQEVPSGHDPARYETRRFFATAPDGAQVPVTVLMQRGTPLNGSAPMLLYGYGSYGIPMDANFSIRRLSLVDRGWVYAIAHVRGGSEMGYGWFLDGRKEKKPNTFTDFIACAEDLIGRGFARAGNIVIQGGSAGGLLVSAANDLRPDLWAGVIAEVPFVDVLNTMSDISLPLTPPEWPEWGNPLEDEAACDLIASYSPYDTIAQKPYPAILATGGLTDPRVTYWEPAKWAAKLRTHTTSGRPVLLKMNMSAGHAGAAGRFDTLKDDALNYAFAIKAVGGEEAGGGF